MLPALDNPGSFTDPEARPLREYVNALRPHLRRLSRWTDDAPGATHPLLSDSIAQLDAVLEELSAGHEQLRAASGLLAQAHWASTEQGAAEQRDFWLAPFAYLLSDAAGTIRQANQAVEHLLGAPYEELAGKALTAFVPDERALRARLLRLAPDGQRESWTGELRTRGGRVRRVHFTVRADAEPDGSVALRWALHELPEPLGGEPASNGAGGAAPAAAPAPLALHGWLRERLVRLRPASPDDLTPALRQVVAGGLYLGYLRPGDALLSIRQTAQSVGLDHRAVAAAYHALAVEGLVTVRTREGVCVADGPPAGSVELSESAEWVSDLLVGASALQLRIRHLPELLQRLSSRVPLRCACVDATADGLAMLAGELQQYWGLDTFALKLPANGEIPREGAALAALREQAAGAHLLVSTAYHAATARLLAAALGRPLVVMKLNPAVVDAVESRLHRGPLTAVVSDAAFGERLRAIRGAENGALRIVPADDVAALAALDPAEPVLLTRAAQERLPGARLRMIVPASRFLSPDAAPELASVLVQHNLTAGPG